ncbi:MAG: hypothetical protein QXT58_04610 [Archaeoglobaceae archaeon]
MLCIGVIVSWAGLVFGFVFYGVDVSSSPAGSLFGADFRELPEGVFVEVIGR